jgi:hypothetical protein
LRCGRPGGQRRRREEAPLIAARACRKSAAPAFLAAPLALDAPAILRSVPRSLSCSPEQDTRQSIDFVIASAHARRISVRARHAKIASQIRV